MRNGSGADGVHDVAMLLLEGLAVGAPGDAGSAADRLPRDDEAAEVLQEPSELRISGGIGNAAMEGEVLADGIVTAPDGKIDGVEAAHDPADLGAQGTIGGQPRGFDLDAGAL